MIPIDGRTEVCTATRNSAVSKSASRRLRILLVPALVGFLSAPATAAVEPETHFGAPGIGSRVPSSWGPVSVFNKTSMAVRVELVSYIDRNGKRRTSVAHWQFAPNEKAILMLGGRNVEAREAILAYVTGGYRNTWRVKASSSKVEFEIGSEHIGPFGYWTGTIGGAKHLDAWFSSSKKNATLVLRLQNKSSSGDLDIEVFDESGRVVAKSNYSGSSDDRCMVQLVRRQQYRIRVKHCGRADADALRFRVSTETVDHGRLMGKAVEEFLLNSVAELIFVGIFGDEEAVDRWLKQKLGGLARDAFVLAAISELNRIQGANPRLDPRGRGLSQAIGQIRTKLVSNSGLGAIFLSKLERALAGACR